MSQQFRLRDHLSTDPTVEQIKSLKDDFPQATRATTIDLTFNNLGAWSADQIAALKGVSPQATTIDFGCTNLGAWSVDQIAALRDVFPQARAIDLCDNDLGAWTIDRIAALKDVFPRATTIDLGANNLGTWSVDQIAALAGVFLQATTIDLAGNNLRAWTVEHIAALVSVFPLATTIDLSYNDLGTWSLDQIAALADVFPQATTIDLGANNLGTWGADHIAALENVFPQATTIILHSNNLRTWSAADACAIALASALASGKCQKRLTYEFTPGKMSDVAATALADALTSGNCPYGTKIIGVNSHIDTLCELNDRMIIHKYGELVASTLVKGLSQELPIEVLKLIGGYCASVLSDDEYQEVAHYANNASQEIFSQAAFRTLFNEHSLCKKYDREARETEAKRQNIFDRQHGLVPYQGSFKTKALIR